MTAFALEHGKIRPDTLRVDTTVVESNIHWPTDSSLLWDSWRTFYRLLRNASKHEPRSIESRFHYRKVKKLHLFVTRYASSPSKKRQRRSRDPATIQRIDPKTIPAPTAKPPPSEHDWMNREDV